MIRVIIIVASFMMWRVLCRSAEGGCTALNRYDYEVLNLGSPLLPSEYAVSQITSQRCLKIDTEIVGVLITDFAKTSVRVSTRDGEEYAIQSVKCPGSATDLPLVYFDGKHLYLHSKSDREMGCQSNYRYISGIAGYTYEAVADFSARNVVDFAYEAFEAVGDRVWRDEKIKRPPSRDEMVRDYIITNSEVPEFEDFAKGSKRQYMKLCFIHERIMQVNDDEFIPMTNYTQYYFDLRPAIKSIPLGVLPDISLSDEGMEEPIAVNVWNFTTRVNYEKAWDSMGKNRSQSKYRSNCEWVNLILSGDIELNPGPDIVVEEDDDDALALCEDDVKDG